MTKINEAIRFYEDNLCMITGLQSKAEASL